MKQKGLWLLGAILRGAKLTGADLVNANLEGADLYGANLCNANCAGANFKGAVLTDANCAGANFAKADMTNVVATQADFTDADLRFVTTGLENFEIDDKGNVVKSKDAPDPRPPAEQTVAQPTVAETPVVVPEEVPESAEVAPPSFEEATPEEPFPNGDNGT